LSVDLLFSLLECDPFHLEHEFESQDHAANSSPELLRLQEGGIRGQYVPLRRECGCDPRNAEYIAIA